MAVVDYEVLPLTDGQYPTGVKVVRWTLTSGDTGSWYSAPNYPGKSVQMLGTGIVTVQGSLVPTQSAVTPVAGTVHKVDLSDLVLTDAEPAQILEDVYQVRPAFTGTTTGTDVDVYLLVTTTARR